MSRKYALKGVVLDAPDPRQLGEFYCRLLGWDLHADEDTWVTATDPDSTTGLSFQLEPNYQPPTWPSEQNIQQMQVHLDIHVDDLETAHRRAIDAGARLMEFQPQPDVRVYADPVGHVFCLFTD
jgi:predicted enzyme related to lactoylglutathione lyase